ncbi:MAG: VpsF family polysaccharide biosynthesis protein, partial [Hyphomicrobiales bacterium]|nr:VpsF family polysaccharide biosynthesis protein [Hyphomicrobiales bacterium]
ARRTPDFAPPRAVVALTLATVAVSFAVSAMALTAMGFHYDAPGGGLAAKLHPATWLAVIALALRVALDPRPLRFLAELPRRFPGLALFVAGLAATVFYASRVQAQPMAPLIDSFFCGAVFLVLWDEFDARERLSARRLLHLVFAANALLALGEFVSHRRLTPFVAGGHVILHDYRSTALLGHPLLNAASTGAYVLALRFGGDPSLSRATRLAAMALQCAAMVAFGGRTAIVLVGFFLAAGASPAVARTLAGRRFDARMALAAAFALPLAAALAYVAISGGALDKLAGRFVDDKGSAAARLVLFRLFGAFPLSDLLLGPGQDKLVSLQYENGIEYGIENSWIGLVLEYGALAAVLFVVDFLALFAELWARMGKAAPVLAFVFFALVTSAAALDVKSFEFNQFAMIALVMAEGRAPFARRAAP